MTSREIHYHFSVPASRQLIQTSQASYTTLLLWAVVAGLRAGPKVAAGRAENFRMKISSTNIYDALFARLCDNDATSPRACIL